VGSSGTRAILQLDLKPDAVVRAERLLGSHADSWTRVESRGYAANEHWTVRFRDGTRAFLKHSASVDPCPEWARDEERVYAAIGGPFMPELLAWEDGDRPLLVLEDLSGARHPPPWEPGDVDAVLQALETLWATPAQAPLPSFADRRIPSWERVAADPAPFLSLGIADSAWLDAALPTLVDAAERTPLAGDAVIHCDVRSDNLCIRDGRAVLFDWNHACVGNPAGDLAYWMPSLLLEGGPPLPGADDFAAYVSGFFASRAGLPAPTTAPQVRSFQLAQLEVALPWACRVHGVPEP
jgi:aminoglycoside phosphotransferase (APT) family kinase protein